MTRIFIFPGQGSQKRGMGLELFAKYSREVEIANNFLNYSIEELCLENAEGKLDRTEYTQPALFVVNALTYLEKIHETGETPDYLAGHSLGELNALFAAGAFDFRTGLAIVQERGMLMSRVAGGGMIAVIGLTGEKIREVMQGDRLNGIEIANFNSPIQTVLSGHEKDIKTAGAVFKEAGARYVIPLKVSAPFHSRYMEEARREFADFLDKFEFSPLQIPVISNVDARPYKEKNIRKVLSEQITHSVRWTDSIRYLLKQPDPVFEEIGPGRVLTGLVRKIRRS